MSYLADFKAFAMRGNVIDLAVAVVIGAAFGKIIASLVEGIIMPLIGLLSGGINVTDKSLTIGNASIKWGLFLQNIIDFTIIAIAIFVVVRLLNSMQNKQEETKKPSEEVALLIEIRDLLKANNSPTSLPKQNDSVT